MDDYLTKPVTLERLDQVVRRWLPAAVALHRKALPTPPAPRPTKTTPPPPAPPIQLAPGRPSADAARAVAAARKTRKTRTSTGPAEANGAVTAEKALATSFAASQLATTLGLSAAEMREFLSEFLADAQDLIERLQAALAEQDDRAAFQAAHALAGAAANVGATALGRVAERIEAHCRVGALEEAASLTPELLRLRDEAKLVVAAGV
jgi:HPt (histidine-containing phosphotransfer) domain-containing protein